MIIIQKNKVDNVIQQYNTIMNTSNFDINNPKLFTEKLQWIKLYDNIPIKKYCANKINLRNYCINKLNKNLCPKILKIYNSPNNIDINTIPNNCIIKCNHGSNMNIICDNNHTFNNNDLIQLKEWFNTDYSIKFNEFFYSGITHKIFIEELLDIDYEYKIFCFNGKPKIIEVIFYDNLNESLYKGDLNYIKQWSRHDALVDINFNLLDNYQFNIPRKSFNEIDFLKENYKNYKFENINLIIDYCKKLAIEFKFVRIDFYITKQQKLYLSETTFIPNAGFINFNNKQTDLAIGEMLKI